ncbi:hypothetical protein SAY86_005702 [Trapa natans]|uniref:Uncharacterized protein n=1 Tax=Trapa natans TaxID=22666 RepID=A0AAN7L3W9_TRANT|nr:hypothetical protein SAY86_005702 [Trapa natans]
MPCFINQCGIQSASLNFFILCSSSSVTPDNTSLNDSFLLGKQPPTRSGPQPRHFLASFHLCLDNTTMLHSGLVHDVAGTLRMTLSGAPPLSSSTTSSRAVGRHDSSGDEQCIARRSSCRKWSSEAAGSGTLGSRMSVALRLSVRELAQSRMEAGSFDTSMGFLPLRISRTSTPKLNMSFLVLSLLAQV